MSGISPTLLSYGQKNWWFGNIWSSYAQISKWDSELTSSTSNYSNESQEVVSGRSSKRTRSVKEKDNSFLTDPLTPMNQGSTMSRPLGKRLQKNRASRENEK